MCCCRERTLVYAPMTAILAGVLPRSSIYRLPFAVALTGSNPFSGGPVVTTIVVVVTN